MDEKKELEELLKEQEAEKEPSKKIKSRQEKYMNELNVAAKSSMRSRIITGLVLIALVLPCIILGNYVFAVLILFSTIICAHEIITTPQSIERKFSVTVSIATYLMMLVTVFYILFKENMLNLSESVRNGTPYFFDLAFGGPQFSLPTFFICVGFFFFAVLVDKKFTVADAFYLITMIIIVGIALQAILFLRYAPFYYSESIVGVKYTTVDAPYYFKYGHSICLLVFLFLGTCMNDVGAYFIGVLFGKHKFAPRISPKKTWEGTIGGVVVSFACSFGFAIALAANGYPILGFMTADKWYYIALLAILMPIFGTFGDLLFSAIKRFYGIKDFGTILKGHGGMLDRLDSTITNAIVISLLVELLQYWVCG